MSVPDEVMKLKDGKIIVDKLKSMVAVQFVQETANDAGTYVVCQGQVYYLPDGHTANTTWENTTKVGPTNIGDELSGVKNAVDGQDNINKAIISVFQHATFADAEGATAYNALYALVYGSVNPYQKVAFVETDGSSRIDTGVLFDGTKNIVVTMEMSFNGTLANNDSILNGWAAGGSMGVSGSQSGKWNEGSYPVEADLGYVDEMTTCVMTINAGTNTNTDYSFTNTHGSREKSRGHTNVANRTYLPFPLFALSKQDSFDFLKSGLRIKSVEIKVGGTVVRSMYACYRKADNVIGFYDETNDVFYTNAGTGSFTKGGDIA